MKIYLIKPISFILIVAFGLSACSIGVRPIDNKQLLADSKLDIVNSQKDIEPLGPTIDLNEAIARGLKYNLDFKVKQYEEALATDQQSLAALEMLPKVVGTAGYYSRNNDLINYSVNPQTGQSTPQTYLSTDRQIWSTNFALSWNILDFGASYFNARQQGDRMMIALERRRRAMHNLVQDIRTAYLRAYSAQILEGSVRDTIAESEAVLEKARKAEKQKLRSPAEILKIQKTILDNIRLLEAIQQELSTARYELASYINIRPGVQYVLAKPDATFLAPKQINLSVNDMEDIAIANNAEFREQIYTARIAKDDIKKNMLRLFPGISFNVGNNYNSNTFLVNNTWRDAAVQVSWNLMNILSIPGQISAMNNADGLYDQKKTAVLMNLVTQVHIARLQYDNNYQAMQRNESLLQVDKKLNDISTLKMEAEVESRLEHVTYSTGYILSLLRKYQALAQLYNSEGKLRSTLGQEIVAGDISKVPLKELSKQVGIALKDWVPKELPQEAAKAVSAVDTDKVASAQN